MARRTSVKSFGVFESPVFQDHFQISGRFGRVYEVYGSRCAFQDTVLRKFVVIEVWNCGTDCSKYINFCLMIQDECGELQTKGLDLVIWSRIKQRSICQGLRLLKCWKLPGLGLEVLQC